MKRAKMLLSAIAIVGVVSGALAFKPIGRGTLFCGATQSACSATPDYTTGGSLALFCGSSQANCQAAKVKSIGIKNVGE